MKLEEKKLMQKLDKEGFTSIRICPIPKDTDSGEHTHDVHTAHVILAGELTIIDKTGEKTYKPGDQVEFPAGTTHSIKTGKEDVSMIVAEKHDSDFPNIGRPATGALHFEGITKLKQLPKYSEKELLQIHGVGPKAIKILREALKEKGLTFKK